MPVRRRHKEASWDMYHIKENLKHHMEFTSMLTKYLVVPMAIFVVIFGFAFNLNLIPIMILSIVLFLICSMLPDYARFTALVMDKKYLMEFSHSATGYAFYVLLFLLFSMMFSSLDSMFILVFSLGGLMVHYIADEFEQFMDSFAGKFK